MKKLVWLGLLLLACGSSSANSSNNEGASGNGGGSSSSACPTLSGTWTIAAHCVSSFVGQTVTITQRACSLTLAAPFDGYTGTVASDGKVDVSGPTATGTQDCTGTSTATQIELSCPGPCAVTLTH